jgi:hypothetical protein
MHKYLLGLFILIPFLSFGQRFEWNVDFEQILDNREYTSDNTYDEDQTILGARANAYTGFSYQEVHNVFVGFNYFHEFGEDFKDEYLFLNLFYKYSKNNFSVYFGSFNRKFLLKYPELFLDVRLNYYKPNINGGLIQYKSDWGYQNIWCDWLQRQSDTIKEQFLAGTSGEFKVNNFYIENYMYMFHDALPKLNKDKYHIRDNGILGLFLGYDFSKNTALDVFKFDIGGILEFDRDRGANDNFQYYKGLIPRLQMEYLDFGVKSSFYFGDKLDLPHGEPLYKSGNYFRGDVYYRFFNSDIIKSKISLNFHVTDGMFDHSQQLFLYIKFDKLDTIPHKKDDNKF